MHHTRHCLFRLCLHFPKCKKRLTALANHVKRFKSAEPSISNFEFNGLDSLTEKVPSFSGRILHRLGHGVKCLSVDIPQLVASLKDRSMIALSCGDAHTAAIDGATHQLNLKFLE